MQPKTDELDEAPTVSEKSRTPSDHYVIRARREYGPASDTRTNPSITADVTRTCISDGEIRDARHGCTKFVAAVDGHEWHLVIDTDLVVTAYVPGQHVGRDVPGVGADE